VSDNKGAGGNRANNLEPVETSAREQKEKKKKFNTSLVTGAWKKKQKKDSKAGKGEKNFGRCKMCGKKCGG